MKTVKTIFTLIFIFNFCLSFAHKDRIEKPSVYQFVFQNNEIIKLENPNDSILKAFSNDIVKGTRKLVRAELSFSTGETIIFEFNDRKWTVIKITGNQKTIEIPKRTLEKIPEIHFESVTLLWNGNDEKIFDADYFYIRFDIGRKKLFGKYPYLQLNFANKAYTKTTINKQVSKNSEQEVDF